MGQVCENCGWRENPQNNVGAVYLQTIKRFGVTTIITNPVVIM